MVANANPMLSAAIFTKIQSGMRPSDGKVYCAPRNNPFGEVLRASSLRENLTSSSYGEGLETGRAIAQAPRQSLTRQETIRFVKQSYQVEDIRVLKYRRLQNMYCLLLAVTYFASVHLGLSTRLAVLAHHAIKAAKRFFGVPDFRYYAIADGIRELFARYGGRISRPCGRPPSPLQPSLFQWA